MMPWSTPPRERTAARDPLGRRRARRAVRLCPPLLAAAALALIAALPAAAGPSPQRTVRIRVAAAGQPNGPSASARISGNGRYVAFETTATNLGPADPNGAIADVYLYDAKSAEIRLLSATPSGGGADGPSGNPAISSDGGVVAFASRAGNLVARANNVEPGAAPHGDVYAWTRAGGVQQVSVSSTQVPADGDSSEADVSADGRMIVFSSTAGNLAAGHTAGQRDVYVRDLASARTTLVSATPDGQVPDGDSSAPAISPDGRFVSFSSTATNLVGGTTTHGQQILVRDLGAATTALASVSTRGEQQSADPASAAAPIAAVSDVSDGGRLVVFASSATNLIGADTNHHSDVFARDTTANRTFRISLATTDQQGDGDSFDPSISADGRFVTFLSRAPNLTPGQPSGVNAFIRDLVAHTTVMTDVSSAGRPRGPEQAAPATPSASSSDDGSTAVFVSSAKRLVTGKTSPLADVFLRHLLPTPITLATGNAGLTRGHVVITFVSTDRQAGPLLCRLDHHVRAICPLGAVVLPLLGRGKHVLRAYAGGPGSAYASRPTTVRIDVLRNGRARVKVTNPGAALGLG